MNPELISLSQRFTMLTASKRKIFLERLQAEGLSFEALPIVAQDSSQPAPLAYAQRALWLAWQRSPQSPAYNLAGRLDFVGPYTAEQVQDCLTTLVQRHAVLRTVYGVGEDGQPVQRVQAEPMFGWSVSTSEGQGIDRAQVLQEAGQAFARQPFNLEHGPVFRGFLHQFGDDRQTLFLAVHHIAADGGSVNLLLQELIALLKTTSPQQADELPKLHYLDYATWQRYWLEAGELERQITYWRTQLADAPLSTALPLDRPRRSMRSAQGEVIGFSVPQDIVEALSSLARQHSASLYMVTVALLNLSLYRYGGNADICIGIPSANRDRAELTHMIGHFTNVLVLRTQLNPQLDFTRLLIQVRDRLLEAKSHQDVPLDLLVETLAIPRTLGLHPLFQVKCAQQMVCAHNASESELHVAGVAVDEVHFDLSLDALEQGDNISWQLAYAADLFDRATIERLIQSIQSLATQVALNPEQPLEALELPDRPSILRGEGRPWPAQSILQLFADSVLQNPQSPAVVQSDRLYSYAELDQASERWAGYLAQQGIGPEHRVALHFERSCAFVMALLAVVKTGATFVPLDPSLPAPRLSALVQDSGASLLLSSAPLSWSAPIPVTQISADELPPEQLWFKPSIHPQQAAYIIYTSGSTGQPKGVVVSHGALVNYVQGLLARLALPKPMRFALVSTVAADLGHSSLFGALCSGGSLHLFDSTEAFDPDAFATRMERDEIEVLKIVPSHLKAVLQAHQSHAILPRHTLILGGETTDTALLASIRSFNPELHILNHYGPTETTVGMLMYRAPQPFEALESLPLGQPIPQTQAYVLDEQLQPVQPGMEGELYVSGSGVARGYLGQAGLTASRFIASPFEAGKRLYRTGDRVRLGSDHCLSFLGRSDGQIKIRGFRVEPDELQAYLGQSAGVEAAVVQVGLSEQKTPVLWAYLVPQSGTHLDVQQLRHRLQQHLPAYLVPDALILLERLPLTANGKIDRQALPSPERLASVTESEQPQGPIEEALAGIWRDILGIQQVARTDNFFALGGDSILSLKLIARIRKHIAGGNGLSLAELMQANSFQELAERLQKGFEKTHDAICLQTGGSGIPLYCLPGLIVNSREFLPLAEVLQGSRPIYSFVSHVYTQKRWRGFSIPTLAAEYADFIEATAVQGRCALLGWSSGGDLAFEVMRLLQGRVEVDCVAMVDVFESEPLKAQRALTDTQHIQARQQVSAWLAQSEMAEHWQTLLARMDDAEHACLADQLIHEGRALPLDGMGDEAEEYLLWAQLDKRVQATRYQYQPSSTPVHVFVAEQSLQAAGVLRAWSEHTPVASTTLIPATDHLGIIRDPYFLDCLKQTLAQLSLNA